MAESEAFPAAPIRMCRKLSGGWQTRQIADLRRHATDTRLLAGKLASRACTATSRLLDRQARMQQ